LSESFEIKLLFLNDVAFWTKENKSYLATIQHKLLRPLIKEPTILVVFVHKPHSDLADIYYEIESYKLSWILAPVKKNGEKIILMKN